MKAQRLVYISLLRDGAWVGGCFVFATSWLHAVNQAQDLAGVCDDALYCDARGIELPDRFVGRLLGVDDLVEASRLAGFDGALMNGAGQLVDPQDIEGGSGVG